MTVKTITFSPQGLIGLIKFLDAREVVPENARIISARIKNISNIDCIQFIIHDNEFPDVKTPDEAEDLVLDTNSRLVELLPVILENARESLAKGEYDKDIKK